MRILKTDRTNHNREISEKKGITKAIQGKCVMLVFKFEASFFDINGFYYSFRHLILFLIVI